MNPHHLEWWSTFLKMQKWTEGNTHTRHSVKHYWRYYVVYKISFEHSVSCALWTFFCIFTQYEWNKPVIGNWVKQGQHSEVISTNQSSIITPVALFSPFSLISTDKCQRCFCGNYIKNSNHISVNDCPTLVMLNDLQIKLHSNYWGHWWSVWYNYYNQTFRCSTFSDKDNAASFSELQSEEINITFHVPLDD